VGSRGKGKPPLAPQQRPRRAAIAEEEAAQAALVEPAPAAVQSTVLPSKSSSSQPTTGAPGVAEGTVSTAAPPLPPAPLPHKRPAEVPKEQPCLKQQRIGSSKFSSSSSEAITVPQPNGVVL